MECSGDSFCIATRRPIITESQLEWCESVRRLDYQGSETGAGEGKRSTEAGCVPRWTFCRDDCCVSVRPCLDRPARAFCLPASRSRRNAALVYKGGPCPIPINIKAKPSTKDVDPNIIGRRATRCVFVLGSSLTDQHRAINTRKECNGTVIRTTSSGPYEALQVRITLLGVCQHAVAGVRGSASPQSPGASARRSGIKHRIGALAIASKTLHQARDGRHEASDFLCA